MVPSCEHLSKIFMLHLHFCDLLVLNFSIVRFEGLLKPNQQVFALPSLSIGEADVPECDDALNLFVLIFLLVFDVQEIAF